MVEALDEHPLSEEDVLASVRAYASSISQEKLYYTLKKLHVRPITQPSLEILRYAVALDHLGLPITTELLTALAKKERGNICVIAHQLGDKHILILKRDNQRNFTWVISDFFKKHLEGEVDGVQG